MSNYSASDIQKVYIAFFGRPGEPEGVDYWLSVSETVSLEQMHAFFAEQQEYRDYYAGFLDSNSGSIIDAEGLLNAVYLNLFNRDIEQEGKDFWVPLLIAGEVSIDNVVTEVLLGAQNSDYLAIQCKLEAATAFTAAVEDLDYYGYVGVDAVSLAHAWLAEIYNIQTMQEALQADALSVTINLLLNNNEPSDIDLTGTIVDENMPGVVIGMLSTVDPDAGDTHTYTVSDERFEVVDMALKLKDGVSLDFETVGRVPVEVSVVDSGGLSYSEEFRITVINVPDSGTHGTRADYGFTVNAPELVDLVISVFFDDEGELLFDPWDVTDIGIDYAEEAGLVTIFNDDGSTQEFALDGIENAFSLSGIDAMEFSYADGTPSALLTDAGGDDTAFSIVGVIDTLNMFIDLVFDGTLDHGNYSSLFDSAPYKGADSSVTINAPELLELVYTTFIDDGRLAFDPWESSDIEIEYAEGEGRVIIFSEDGGTQEFVLEGIEDTFRSSGIDDLGFSYAGGTATALITDTEGDLLEIAVVGIDTAIDNIFDMFI